MNLEELDIKHRLATGTRTFEEFCKVIELLDAPASIEWFSYSENQWRPLEPWTGTFAEAIEYIAFQCNADPDHAYQAYVNGIMIRQWGGA